MNAAKFDTYRLRRGHAANPTPTEVRTAAEAMAQSWLRIDRITVSMRACALRNWM